jgi:hypothetical protein
MSGFELADRVPAAEVTVNSLHPATYMPTKMVLAEIGYHVDCLDDGVAATRRLVTDPALARTTGRFFDRTREARANAQAYDPGPEPNSGNGASNSSASPTWPDCRLSFAGRSFAGRRKQQVHKRAVDPGLVGVGGPARIEHEGLEDLRPGQGPGDR